jgi:hypothetical protein
MELGDWACGTALVNMALESGPDQVLRSDSVLNLKVAHNLCMMRTYEPMHEAFSPREDNDG